jgi:hypothetical protein
MTNKSGHGPRTGLGYQFDSTMGYPGEGPSHSRFTQQGTRPSLRVWFTKRPGQHMVDPLRVRLDVSPISLAPKLAHGNSDTRLGRWLHSSRSPLSTGLSQADSPRRDNDVEKDTSPVSRVPAQTLRVPMISTFSMRTDDRSRETVVRSHVRRSHRASGDTSELASSCLFPFHLHPPLLWLPPPPGLPLGLTFPPQPHPPRCRWRYATCSTMAGVLTLASSPQPAPSPLNRPPPPSLP